MKAVLQLSFFVFYIASSYAVTQERTVLQVQRSQAAGNPTLEQTCHECHFAFPHFRQAKPKHGADSFFFHTESVHLIPHVSEHTFTVQTVSFKSIASLENTHLRAPPFQL
jgi:hypothetical protein